MSFFEDKDFLQVKNLINLTFALIKNNLNTETIDQDLKNTIKLLSNYRFATEIL